MMQFIQYIFLQFYIIQSSRDILWSMWISDKTRIVHRAIFISNVSHLQYEITKS